VVQGVRAGRVPANGGRHARPGRYRGRHRKAGPQIRLGTGIRVAVTVACAALFVCLPQPSWAARTGTGTVAAHVSAASRVTVTSLPDPVRLICSTRLG
jgi:hypothetical protein